MTDPAAHRPLSVEEYLRSEETSPVRREFVAGEVYAMSGGTLRHNQIALNIATQLFAAARGWHWRDDQQAWHTDEVAVESGDGIVRAPCPALTLTLDEIYDGVELPVSPEWPRRVREGRPAGTPTTGA